MKPFILIIILFFNLSSFSQKDSIYRPTTFEEMFLQMDNALTPTQIKTLKELTEDSIRKTNVFTADLTKGYNYYNDSKIVKELEARGINYDDRYVLIALSYHRYLNGRDLKLEDQFHYYDSLNIEQEKCYQEALKQDTIEGKYIPLNLPDCFIELDNILSDKAKQNIGTNGVSGLHLTLGMYIRNRWQLWNGSRLKKYFMNLGGDFMHPDAMSTVILRYYYQWLKGNKVAWRDWVIEQEKNME